MSGEAHTQAQILLKYGRGDTRLWRNNVGTGWTGQAIRVTAANRHTLQLQPGDVVVRNSRPLHAGLCVGSGDLIGYRSLEVTPEMVGSRLAQFASIEVKTATGRIRPEQAAFAEHITSAGGIGGIVRCSGDAEALLRGQAVDSIRAGVTPSPASPARAGAGTCRPDPGR